MSESWLDISFGDEESHNRLLKSLNNCWMVHRWTVKVLNDSLYENFTPVKYMDFRPALNLFIYENDLLKGSQRYSLLRAAEKTFPYFTSKPKFDVKMRLIKIDPIPNPLYSEIQIQSRKPWVRYLANDRPITTVYGTIFLERDWKEILKQQAEEAKIPASHYSSILYLIHSITLQYVGREEWKMRFNIHPYREQKEHKKKNAEN